MWLKKRFILVLSKSFLVGLVVLQICNKPEVNLCINCFDTTTKEETAEFKKLYTTNHKVMNEPLIRKKYSYILSTHQSPHFLNNEYQTNKNFFLYTLTYSRDKERLRKCCKRVFPRKAFWWNIFIINVGLSGYYSFN